MDLLKTPSVQSLLDSDIESVESLQCLDFEELDEVEYALPASEAPTLAEVLLSEEGELQDENHHFHNHHQLVRESTMCSALQVDFLQAVSQQLTQAQERSAAGPATALSVTSKGKLTVGTAHGHLLSFQDQILRWVCDTNADRGAVSCLAYSVEGDRLLVGFARGLICQYETSRGLILRRVTLGGEIWGILRVTWAGTSGLALDTGGSVWLIKFARPLGVRSARSSCLFSGARGEVVAMAPRDARILALATLSRVIIVAGGRAAGVRLGGPSDTLPVLAWCEADDRLLVCARGNTLQWLSVDVNGVSVSLRLIKRFELKTVPLWLGWIGGGLAVFDVDENLRLWGEDYDKSLDLSHIEPVYASAFFKGLWTDGRVSRAMCAAGAGALGGAVAHSGELSILGRRGIVRVRARDRLARARALFASARYAQALRLLASGPRQEAQSTALEFVTELAERPNVLSDKHVADELVKLCLKFDLSEELWSNLWERCSEETAFVEAIADAVVRGELTDSSPSPECTQALIERLAQFEPGLVERVVASLPLTSLDPHRASVFTRDKGLWRAVGAIAAALGGSSGAMRELTKHVERSCRGSDDHACSCAGDALLLIAADGLAGRGPAGRAMPDHARPSARHDALQTLLSEEVSIGTVVSPAPLCALVRHDARSCVRLLEQSWREPPFVGPLGKQNRLRVARAALHYATDLEETDQVEVLEFICNQMSSGALPSEREICAMAAGLAVGGAGERGDRVLIALQDRTPLPPAAAARPRVAWRIATNAQKTKDALELFFQIDTPSEADVDELFEFLHARVKENADIKGDLEEYLRQLIDLRPRAVAALMSDRFPDSIVAVLRSSTDESVTQFAKHLLEMGALQGDAVAAYLRNLCLRSPSKVKKFLLDHKGAVRPEDALAIVKESGPRDAEPLCLEAAGDPEGALAVTIDLISLCDTEDNRTRLVEEACSLCTRVCPSVPRAAARDMWASLLKCTDKIPARALLDAVAYVPADSLVGYACDSPQTAAQVLELAASEACLWRMAARVLQREVHAANARAMRAAGRGVAGAARCGGCGAGLSGRALIAVCQHSTRTHHAECPPPECAQCPREVSLRRVALPPRPACRPAAPQQHELTLVAPPRPDLEGIV